jgi:hypothetical protein
MQTVTILRQLWRFRVLTAVIGVVAILAGVLVVYNPSSLQSRQYQVGVATSRILVDTPDSQVVDVMPKGADALGVRANLLSNLMVDGVVKAQIARRAGISPDSFYGMAESGSGPKPKVPSGRKVVLLKTRLLTQSDGTPLPIIEIEATAPDTARATALADGAVTGLRDYLNTKAAEQKVSDGSRLRVSGLGIAQAHAQTRGPSAALGVVAALLVFCLGSGILLGVAALVRALRETPDPAVAGSAAEPVDAEPDAVAQSESDDEPATGVWRAITVGADSRPSIASVPEQLEAEGDGAAEELDDAAEDLDDVRGSRRIRGWIR